VLISGLVEIQYVSWASTLGMTWGEMAGVGGLVVGLIGISVTAWNTKRATDQEEETGLLGITMASSKEIIADLRIEVDRCNAGQVRLRDRLAAERERFTRELGEARAREAALEVEVARLREQISILDERVHRQEGTLGMVARREDLQPPSDGTDRRRADDDGS
jgi:hypothetical protein